MENILIFQMIRLPADDIKNKNKTKNYLIQRTTPSIGCTNCKQNKKISLIKYNFTYNFLYIFS